ncbi:signal peptidase I [Streptomyces sp. L7]
MGNRGKPRGAAPGGNYGNENLLPTGFRRAGALAPAGGAGRSRAERRKLQRKVKRRRRRGAVREIPLLVGVAVLIALVLKTFLVQAFVIPSGSMEQTIRVGDRVLVDKFTPWFGSEPKRGDVVVFHDPGGWLGDEGTTKKNDPVVVKQVKEGLQFIGLLPSDNEKDLIKRVIGVGGDHVKCCRLGRAGDRQRGSPDRGRLPVSWERARPRRRSTSTVPKGRLRVMGDHRGNSADSRVTPEHQLRRHGPAQHWWWGGPR